MQPISSYAKDDHLRLILQGPPGRGKTCLATQFPKAYIIDLDANLGSALDWIRRTGASLPVGYDRVDIDEKGVVVEPKLRYLRLAKLLQEAAANPEIETVVLDSGTALSPIFESEILRQHNKNSIEDWKDGRQFWGFYYKLGVHFMSTLKQMNKHIVMPVHEATNKTADGSVVYPIKIAWPGRLGEMLGAFFTDVWRCEVTASGAGANIQHKYTLRTTPEYMYDLKNSRGLPPIWTFSWPELQARLKGEWKS